MDINIWRNTKIYKNMNQNLDLWFKNLSNRVQNLESCRIPDRVNVTNYITCKPSFCMT